MPHKHYDNMVNNISNIAYIIGFQRMIESVWYSVKDNSHERRIENAHERGQKGAELRHRISCKQ